MNNSFIPLGLLVNTSTYYGPLDYTLQITNNIKTLDTTFSSKFNLFSDPIPNTIDQIINTWPGITDLVAKLDHKYQVSFTVSIGCWTVKDAHLMTFQDEFQRARFRKNFQDRQVISVRELKQHYNIVDERDEQVIAFVEKITKEFELNSTQEYLIVDLINKEISSEVVSNYSLGYKCLFKSLELDSNFQTLSIYFIICDYYNLAKTFTSNLGSKYRLEIKLSNTLPNNIDELLATSSKLCIKVPSITSENFNKYLQLIDKLKNWSKYNQVDMFAKEILNSNSENYVEYVNKILGCETKINNSLFNMGYVETIDHDNMLKELQLQMSCVPYDPNGDINESFY